MKRTRVEHRAAYLRKKSPERTRRRICDRCHKVGYYKPGTKACQQLIGLLGTYRCPGKLHVMARKPKHTVKEALQLMSIEAQREQDRAEKHERKQQAALLQARKKVDQYVGMRKRAERLLHKWEGIERRLSRQVMGGRKPRRAMTIGAVSG